MDLQTISNNAARISARCASDRRTRQLRRPLEPADFAQAGFPLTAVPVEYGGAWEDVRFSIRSVCDMLRALAQGDRSVALVASMHPVVTATPGGFT